MLHKRISGSFSGSGNGRDILTPLAKARHKAKWSGTLTEEIQHHAYEVTRPDPSLAAMSAAEDAAITLNGRSGQIQGAFRSLLLSPLGNRRSRVRQATQSKVHALASTLTSLLDLQKPAGHVR